ncbi:hypothetical protein OPV22_008640 [Ensete ventricosum]|uniref:Uncharacterized protein n=1 Tax=Ensete ventricosum TaxID=4639 RepID=A0AAV8RH03_ENSVE|nr:hypothetical protein OPV22_008640 [Ensete ventricosum]
MLRVVVRSSPTRNESTTNPISDLRPIKKGCEPSPSVKLHPLLALPCSPSARRLCRSTTWLHLRCHHLPSEAVATASDLVVVAKSAIIQVAIQATVDLILLHPIQAMMRPRPVRLPPASLRCSLTQTKAEAVVQIATDRGTQTAWRAN